MFTFSWSMLPTWPMVAMQSRRNISQLAGGQSQQSHAVFLSHQLSHDAGGTGKLSALAGVQLNVVDEGTDGDVGKRQCVAGLNICIAAPETTVSPTFRPLRSDDVSLLAVLVLHAAR